MRSCMGVALVAMTDVSSEQLNTTEFKGENATKEFETQGLLNAMLLIPPVSTFYTNIYIVLCDIWSLN